MKKRIMRGDIFYADLGMTVGSEQGGVRPVLIIQNDEGNKFSPTVIIAAITGSKKARIPTHVIVPNIPAFSTPLQHFTLCKTPVTGGLLPVTEASKGRISISTFSFVILEERHIFVPSLRGLLIV